MIARARRCLVSVRAARLLASKSLVQCVLVAGALALSASCTVAQPITRPQPPFAATVSIRLDGGTPVNRRILGNNVQWIDRGDELLQPGTTSFAPGLLNVIDRLPVTVLRYPGGSLADLYDWRAGMGPLANRGEGQHAHQKRSERVAFGTREFLELCARLGAEPMITVNIASGTPESAAEWVRLTNVTRVRSASGATLPSVRLWEIGNEPYLRLDVHPELSRPPAEVASTIDRFIQAMRAVDPSIQFIVPLRSDRISGLPATPFQGYNAAVLAGTRERYDYVSVHDAYLPFVAGGRTPSDRDLFLALMAAPLVVQRDLAATRDDVARARPNARVALAVTEYNAFVTIGRGRSDAYITSQAGALYIADLLRVFAQTDVGIANFWSLNGNWNFGAISNRGEPRPAFYVLTAFDTLLRGTRLPADVRSPTFDNPAVGWVARMTGTPLISALATRQGDTLRVLLINKSPDSPASITMQVPSSSAPRLVAASEMVARSPFEIPSGSAPGWRSVTPVMRDSVTVAPHSLLRLDYLLTR